MVEGGDRLMNPELAGLISLVVAGGIVALTFVALNIFFPPPSVPDLDEGQIEKEDSLNSY